MLCHPNPFINGFMANTGATFLGQTFGNQFQASFPVFHQTCNPSFELTCKQYLFYLAHADQYIVRLFALLLAYSFLTLYKWYPCEHLPWKQSVFGPDRFFLMVLSDIFETGLAVCVFSCFTNINIEPKHVGLAPRV